MYEGIDYLSVWIGQHNQGDDCATPPCFNPYWHGTMLQTVRERGLNAVYYAYIIAFLAKATGLNDCDIGPPDLCHYGANFIREHEPMILRTCMRHAPNPLAGVACPLGRAMAARHLARMRTHPRLWERRLALRERDG